MLFRSGNKGFYPFDYNNVITGGTYNTDTLYLDVTKWYDSKATQYYHAYFYNSPSEYEWVTVDGITSSNKIGTVANPGNYSNVIFVRGSSATGSWNTKWDQTGDLTVPDGSNDKTTWTATSYNNGSTSGDWTSTSGLTPS